MSVQLGFWVGNLNPSIVDQITDENGVGVDLTTATVRFRMRPVGSSTLKVDQPASFKDVSGNVRYDWTAADVDTAGQYLVWWTATRAGKQQDVNEAMVVFRQHTPIVNGYLEPDQWKSTLEMTNQRYADQDIDLAIGAASRIVDNLCGRRFYPDPDALQVRYYTADRPDSVPVDDLITLTSVETAPGSDGMFTQTWTVDTDFRLAPYDAPAAGRPWRRLELTPQAAFNLPGWPHAVKVTGRFGWPTVPANIVEATSLIATQLLRRVREAPFGIVGFGVDGQVARISRTDPQLALLLDPYTSRRNLGMV